MGQKYKVFGQSFFLSLWDKTWYKICQKFPSVPRENLRKLALFADISKKKLYRFFEKHSRSLELSTWKPTVRWSSKMFCKFPGDFFFVSSPKCSQTNSNFPLSSEHFGKWSKKKCWQVGPFDKQAAGNDLNFSPIFFFEMQIDNLWL
jgi:hypothetical protein